MLPHTPKMIFSYFVVHRKTASYAAQKLSKPVLGYRPNTAWSFATASPSPCCGEHRHAPIFFLLFSFSVFFFILLIKTLLYYCTPLLNPR